MANAGATGNAGTNTPNGNTVPGQFQPITNGYGVTPAYQGGAFPSPTYFNPAQLNFTNPSTFAAQYSPTVQNQVVSNANLSSGLALSQLNTELQGLEGFAPAAAALKQNLTSADNQFNQQQRTQQVNNVIPGAQGVLSNQLSQAQTYASGNVPDSITNNALTLNANATAASNAAAGGFGASSSVAQKAGALLNANQRIQLSQYGNQLLGQNLQTQNALLLSPTEYSNAGQEISAAPSVSGSQLASNNLSQINQLSVTPASTAYQGSIQQNETQANFQQQANQTNAATANNFALTQFGYNVSYAGIAAGAQQTNINTQLQVAQQQQYNNIMQQYINESQLGGLLSSGASAAAALNAGGSNSILSGISNLFNGSSNGGSAGTSVSGSLGTAGQTAASTGAFPNFGYNTYGAGSSVNLGYDPNEFTDAGLGVTTQALE